LVILGSEEMVETVIENLIDNAASYSPPSGEILVRLKREGGMAHIAVLDQGPGVPTVQIGLIFDRYYSQRRDSPALPEAGTYFGIGLSIARRHVEAMHGTITAENRSPNGFAVHVRLPLAAIFARE
jgi:two-component system sensor histidine kinase ChvG